MDGGAVRCFGGCRAGAPDQGLGEVLQRLREERVRRHSPGPVGREPGTHRSGKDGPELGFCVCRIIDVLGVSLAELAAAVDAERALARRGRLAVVGDKLRFALASSRLPV